MHNQPREPQTYEDCQAKSIQEFEWTSQGMDWGWEWNLATVVTRSVLPGLRRRRTGLLPSGPKSFFQMRASFAFHLETKVLESEFTVPEPLRESMGYCQEENEKQETKKCRWADELKANVKETWASIPPQQCHKLITSMPHRIETVIKAKGAPTKYRVHIQ